MLETTAGLTFDQWEQLESFQLIEAIGTSVVGVLGAAAAETQRAAAQFAAQQRY